MSTEQIPSTAASDIALCLKGVHKRYGHRVVLNGVDLTLRKGSIMGLLGKKRRGENHLT